MKTNTEPKADGVHWEKTAGKFDSWEVWHNGGLYCSVSTSDQAGDIYKRLCNPRPALAHPATLDQRVEATQAICHASNAALGTAVHETLAGFPVLSVVLDAGGCAVSVDLCHSGAQLEESRASVGNLRHVEVSLPLVLAAPALRDALNGLQSSPNDARKHGAALAALKLAGVRCDVA